MPNFRPDTGGRRWSLIQVAGSVALRGGAGAAFPFALLRLPAALYGPCPALHVVPVLRSPTKSCACVLCLPHRSGSGSQELDGCTLPRCGAPSALRVPCPSPRPPRSGACALCLTVTLLADVDHPESQEVFNQKREACLQCSRGCGPWGRACRFPLPPASCLLWGWAGLQPASSSLDLLGPFVLRTAGSVFGLVHFLSPLLSHSLSCYLTKAPSDCSQGTQAGPYPEQCRPLLSVLPLLAGGRCGRLGYFSAGSCFQARNLWVLFIVPSQSGCPLRFKNFPQTRQCEAFLVFGNFLY